MTPHLTTTFHFTVHNFHHAIEFTLRRKLQRMRQLMNPALRCARCDFDFFHELLAHPLQRNGMCHVYLLIV